MTRTRAARRWPWSHSGVTLLLVAVVWWAFHWQLSALQWLGLLLIAIVLWHALQSRRPMAPAGRWGAVSVVLLAFAATLPLDRPWTAPWWPGSGLAGDLPEPCASGTEQVAALVPDAAAAGSGYADLRTERRSCRWENEDRLLHLEFRLHPWQGTGDDAVGEARGVFAERREHADAEELHFGDESYRDPLGDVRVTVEARRANVLVSLNYYAAEESPPLTEEEKAALEQLAARAVKAVDVD
ncbi:hypothetical protein PJ985_05085 [Streptomyces sp. ACA25]|uniref:hypothetical protein n=1 Tax=Streptomyces sp. ACA25 TaxID=3022596 RepID=UPI002306DF00|nr:hypothetical protein [Streptomyces sp. ACA25]MDB1086938.1 hypothetical protein [Streptomyces sp. ACA25]